MNSYLNLLQDVLENGQVKTDRTGTGTLSVFGRQARYDLTKGFPCLTTKKLHLRSIIHELLWFIKGETNISYLKKNNVTIWDEWADENGELGPIYGKQWRSWSNPNGESIDQIQNLLINLQQNPDSRRHLVSGWNVAEISQMALPPCHTLFQFYVTPPNEKTQWKAGLSCQLYQRSADLFLGVPFNIASYALLTHLIAQVCDMIPLEFVHTFGDLHLYSNHLEQTKLQFSRKPLPLPRLQLNPKITNLFEFTSDDIHLLDYQAHPSIVATIAV